MHVLVTGAGGYIGSVLVPLLLERGHSVAALDMFYFGAEKLPHHPNLTLIREDVRRLGPWHFVGVDAVIDLAGVSNDPAGEAFAQATMEINHVARAFNCAYAKQAKVKRYIVASSCSVYGFNENRVREGDKINPLTTYAQANALAEQSCLALADNGFTVVALRQATVYGPSPRIRFDLSVNVMTLDAVTKGEIAIGGDGRQARPFVHVKDTADAQMFMLTAPAEAINGRIFNVGGENVSILELAQRIQAVTGAQHLKAIGSPDHRSYAVNFAAINALGWHPKHNLEDGVAELSEQIQHGLSKTPETITLDWYRRIGAFGEAMEKAA